MTSPATRFQPYETKIHERRIERNKEQRRIECLRLKLQELRGPNSRGRANNGAQAGPICLFGGWQRTTASVRHRDR